MKNGTADVLIKQLLEGKEQEFAAEGDLLKTEFIDVYESLKPINLILNTLKDLVGSTKLKNELGDVVLGLATGFVAKKIFLGRSPNSLQKLAGTILEMVIASKITSNAEDIKAISAIMIRKLMHGSLDVKRNTMPH